MAGGGTVEWRLTSLKEPVMTTLVHGVVKDGVVVPSSPLPEGAKVEIRLQEVCPAVPPDLQAEFDAWDSASAQALELVEEMANEGRAVLPNSSFGRTS
jgi:hypothetical protein